MGVAWVLLLVAAPVLPLNAQVVLYAIGSLVCHQRAERSFHLAGAQLPVCARCFGIYLGAAFGAMMTAGRRFVGSPTSIGRANGGRTTQLALSARWTPRVLLAIVGLPTIGSIVLERAGLWDPQNIGRAAAGLVLGAGVAAVVLTLHYGECVPRRPNVPHRPPIHF